MKTTHKTARGTAAPLSLPALGQAPRAQEKVQRALEIRESSAKAREGKPLAFPAQRTSP